MIRNLFVSCLRCLRAGHYLILVVLLGLGLLYVSGQPIAHGQEPLEPAQLPDAQSGLPLYANRCANCHGPLGQGDGSMSANLAQPPRDYTDEAFRRTAVPAVLFQTISEGRLDAGMPPFGTGSSNPISVDERWDLVGVIYSLGTPAEAIERGKVAYEAQCLACHGESGAGDGPDAAASEAELPDLTNLRYWSNRSNEMVFASLQDETISDHTYVLEDDELWDVVDYARTFSYVYADPLAEPAPVEPLTISGQVTNGTTDELITEGTVLLRAFTPELQETLALTTPVGADGRYTFDVSDAGRDWVFMSSIEQGDLNFSSSPQRLETGGGQLEMPIVVYDTTSDPSAININQVHWIVDFANDRLQVNEIYVLSNLEPAVFVGETGIPEEGTLRLAVPEGAENVSFQRSFRSFENFLPATEVMPTEDGYADTVPIRPGDGAMNLLVSYELPYVAGMTVEHPIYYDTNNATIVLPAIGLEIEGDAWTTEGAQQMGDVGSVLSYARSGLAAGETIAFTVEGRPTATAGAGGSVSVDNDLTSILLGGIVLLVVAGGATFTLLNWRGRAGESVDRDAGRANHLLDELVALDEAYEAGELNETIYQQRRTKMLDELASIWHAPQG